MIAIFGSSGHAREIESILRSLNKPVNYFVSNKDEATELNGIPVVSESFFLKLINENKEHMAAYVAIGSCSIRKTIVTKIISASSFVRFPNLFHRSLDVDTFKNRIELGEGNIFFPGVILTNDIKIGNHNHFNICSSISHDCKIGDYNTFSPGVRVSGTVKIGNSNFFGTNSSVIDNIELGENLVIGAASVIVKNILDKGTYVGVPAKKIK